LRWNSTYAIKSAKKTISQENYSLVDASAKLQQRQVAVCFWQCQPDCLEIGVDLLVAAWQCWPTHTASLQEACCVSATAPTQASIAVTAVALQHILQAIQATSTYMSMPQHHIKALPAAAAQSTTDATAAASSSSLVHCTVCRHLHVSVCTNMASP
jgi:hypothetical protein